MLPNIDTAVQECATGSLSIPNMTNTMLSIGAIQEETFSRGPLHTLNIFLTKGLELPYSTATDYAVLYMNSIQGYLSTFSKGCHNFLYILTSQQVFDLLKYIDKY